MRFREAEATDCFAAREWRQPPLALLLGAVGINRIHHQTALHRDEAAQAAVAALELLAYDAVADGIHARAVVALDGAAENAQFGNLLDELHREVVLFQRRRAPAA